MLLALHGYKLTPVLYQQVHTLVPGTTHKARRVARRLEQVRHKMLEFSTVHGTAPGPSSPQCFGRVVWGGILDLAVLALAQKPFPHHEADEPEDPCQEPFPHGGPMMPQH